MQRALDTLATIALWSLCALGWAMFWFSLASVIWWLFFVLK